MFIVISYLSTTLMLFFLNDLLGFFFNIG